MAVRSSRRARGRLIAFGAVAALALAVPAGAQGAGKGFLFEEPRWTLAVRGGLDRANARSELFEFVTDTLTLSRSDFSAVSVSADLAVAIRPRLDLSFSAGYASSTTPSEFRKYVGADDLPITQTTTFVRVPVMVSVKGYALPRGQSIGSLAWIPARFAPYAGVGGGMLMYRFQQEGEFVDSESANLDIFRDRLVSTGWVPAAHGLAGFDVALSPRWGITTEAKYTVARKQTDNTAAEDFQNYRIDLSGLSATMGLHVRF